MSMDDSEAAGRLGGYAHMILGIDDTVNPVGVECWMRLQYGTLDHLPRETFAAEAAMAKVGEELQPGSLREIAGTYGSAERYDIAQGIIDADRGGDYPRGVTYPAIELARDGQIHVSDGPRLLQWFETHVTP